MLKRRILISVTWIVLLVSWAVPAFAQTIPTNPNSIPFPPMIDYSAGAGPHSVFCADLDSDTDLVLAVADFRRNSSCKENRHPVEKSSPFFYGCCKKEFRKYIQSQMRKKFSLNRSART